MNSPNFVSNVIHVKVIPVWFFEISLTLDIDKSKQSIKESMIKSIKVMIEVP